MSDSYVHPGSDKRWLPGIEALRGIAALTVVAHHAWTLSTQPRFRGYWVVEGFGAWGVYLFFMLSGYLLSEPFFKDHRPDSRTYAIRRFFRIGPAYYVNVLILFLFFATPGLTLSVQGAKQIAANVTFTQYLFPSTASNLNVNGALWTMTLEVMLYLLLPVMALSVKRNPWVAFFVMVAIGIGWRYLLAAHGDGIRQFYFGEERDDFGNQTLFLGRQFLGVLPLFALGIMTRWIVFRGYMTSIYTRLPRLGVFSIVGLTLPSILLLHEIERGTNFANHGFFAVYDFLLMILAVPALLLAARPIEYRPTISWRVATWLGVRSYSIYLWHFPIVLALYERGPMVALPVEYGYWWRIPVVFGLTLLFAAVSYRTIELPGMRFARSAAARLSKGSEAEQIGPGSSALRGRSSTATRGPSRDVPPDRR